MCFVDGCLVVQEKASVILPKLVKHFFNEKEVTSSLVMDGLFAGCKLLDAASRANGSSTAGPSSSDSGAPAGSIAAAAPQQQVVCVDAGRGVFMLQGDALQLSSCAALDSLPLTKMKVCSSLLCPRLPSDPCAPIRHGTILIVMMMAPSAAAALRSSCQLHRVVRNDDRAVQGIDNSARADSGDGGGGGDADADERKLADLGRRTIEMFTISHIFSTKLRAAFDEEQALRRQEALIREEEEASRMAGERLARKAEADKEKRAKKKARFAFDVSVERHKIHCTCDAAVLHGQVVNSTMLHMARCTAVAHVASVVADLLWQRQVIVLIMLQNLQKKKEKKEAEDAKRAEDAKGARSASALAAQPREAPGAAPRLASQAQAVPAPPKLVVRSKPAAVHYCRWCVERSAVCASCSA